MADRSGPGGSTSGALLVRDVMDSQLESSDGKRIGRIGDLEAELSGDGRLRVTAILVGPQVLLGRLSYRLREPAHRLLRGRYLQRVPIDEVEETGPTVRLRGRADAYTTGRGDRWIADRVLRFIPGHGRAAR
ncbi:MAG TPA: hypothetical protein VKB00_02130 [Candidatus Limnocylindrales bacterium]|nr:hypothetical protein [Candidatus Limnocylindrales bacterium]